MYVLIICISLVSLINGQESPKVIPFSPIIKPVINGKTSFTCQSLSGSMPLTIEWLKDGKKLINSSIRIRNNEDSSLLTIDSISSSHSGNYTCRILNRFGFDSYSTELKVEGPPNWIDRPNNVEVNLGDNFSVKCSASGYPHPKVYWKKMIDLSWNDIKPSDLSYIQIKYDEIIIKQATQEHGGKYGCSVSNGIAPDLWSEFKVIINVFPAKFKEKKAFVSAKKENILELECSAEGDLPLTIKWSKDSAALSKIDSQRYQIVDQPKKDGIKSILTINSVDIVDDGSYQCLAENSFGKDERIIRVTIIEPPTSPQNFQVRQAWSRSISLTWTAPSSTHSPVLSYIIRYWKFSGPNGNERLKEVNISSPMNSYMINNLEPGTFYESEIIAVNEVGQGQPSRLLKFETGEEEPNGAPVDLVAIARGPTTIRVSWKPPPKNKWNGKLLGYYVGYKRSGDFKSPYSFKIVDVASHNNTYEYLLTSLIKGTSYGITVKAFNSAGSGPEYQEIVAETLTGDVPPAPRLHIKSVTSDSLILRYKIVPGSAAIQMVQLHFKESDELDWKELALSYEGKEEFNEYTLTSLNSNTLYKVYVTLTNENGISDPSPVVISRTNRSPRDVPSSAPGAGLSDSALNGHFYSFREALYFPAITITTAIIIIVIVIAFVLIKKARLDASTKSNFEFCQAYQGGTLAYNHATGTTFGTVQRFVDHDKTMSLVAGPFDEPSLPTPYSKIPIGTDKHNSSLPEARHLYDYPQ